ncbi:MAG: hypothetical protein JO244_10665 [Solirubrobacterales bacterium]|nr:hypothetical protein [Solirubrobacterales bacterium]
MSGGDFGGSGAGSGGGSGPPSRRRTDEVDGGRSGLILAGSLLGALLLIVSEFTALYTVHLATSSAPFETVSGGAHNSYAMLIIGLAAVALGIAVWRSGSRPALLGLGILGVVALLIALLGDLPDSQASGLAGSAAHGYINATSTPSAGLYMETLGAILLIATSGLGFILYGSLGTRGRRRAADEGGDDGAGGASGAGAAGGAKPGAGEGNGRREGRSQEGAPSEPDLGRPAPQTWTRRKRSTPGDQS